MISVDHRSLPHSWLVSTVAMLVLTVSSLTITTVIATIDTNQQAYQASVNNAFNYSNQPIIKQNNQASEQASQQASHHKKTEKGSNNQPNKHTNKHNETQKSRPDRPQPEQHYWEHQRW